MPELPDIVVYIEALQRRVMGKEVTAVRVTSPAVMRTYDPPFDAPVGRSVASLHRVGKRIVFGFSGSHIEGGRPPSDPPPGPAQGEQAGGPVGGGVGSGADLELEGGRPPSDPPPGPAGGGRAGSRAVGGVGSGADLELEGGRPPSDPLPGSAEGEQAGSRAVGGVGSGADPDPEGRRPPSDPPPGPAEGEQAGGPVGGGADLYLVIHLMVAGRLRWEAPGKAIPKKVGLAALDFEHGSLILTEQGTHKRAGIWVMADWESVADLDRGGIEPLDASREEFSTALRSENRTLKRALTDPRIFSGIGNAYSDEILWAARLSPVKRTSQLGDEEVGRLRDAVIGSLEQWTQALREEVGEDWPSKVTAFRDDMAVHGKFGEPCPRCGSKVQRIVYSSNETNYCAVCQTEGKVLADRSLSRLLKDDWPRTVEELEGS